MSTEYDFKKIEEKWQKIWEDEKYGISDDASEKPKFYSLIEFPYPSGSGLHVGHCMMYSAADAHARMMRMRGYNVMFPMGWDAFGLPTENYAIKNKIKPQDATADNVVTFKRQQKALGYSFDWSREINTTDPEYYRWTQWIFLQFYKHAVVDGKLIEVGDDDKTTPRLAFQAEMPVNWCPSCKIILANEEVVAGKCERCGTQSEKRKQKQWMLRITSYAERLIADLETVDYQDKVKTQQINWIGKSYGAEVKFPVKDSLDFIPVYTTRIDTIFSGTYLILAPENSLIEKFNNKIENLAEVEKYIDETRKKSDLQRTELEKDKSGVELKGITVLNPATNTEMPVWIADFVLPNYGTGSVFADAHDERDFVMAKKYGIPLRVSIRPTDDSLWDKVEKLETCFHDEGRLVNSGEFDGLTSAEARPKIIDWLENKGLATSTTNFKLRDWIFSRQHYWGEPIPIIHCDKCGIVPVAEDQLPVILPDVENYEPTSTGESPLAKMTDWVETTCPKCGGKARRETDTMPNWAGSSWYFLRYCDPKNDKQFASNEKLDKWMPVDLYNGGPEHITLHLLYSRFWHKFLFDLGVVPGAEPYAKRVTHGIILGPDGQKMSKSRGNTIDPDDVAKQFGADTLRAYIMFIGPYDQESAWNTAGVQGVFRFLKRLWLNIEKIDNKEESPELLIKLNQTIAGVSDDLENFRMNTVVSKLMEMNNAIEKTGHISKESFAKYLLILYPAVPHLASELWEMTGQSGKITDQKWPEADNKYLQAETIEIVVQINGKVRDRISVKADISDEELKSTALGSDKVKEVVGDKEIIKTIVVPKRLVSIVVK